MIKAELKYLTVTQAIQLSKDLKGYYGVPKIASNSETEKLAEYRVGVERAVGDIYYNDDSPELKLKKLEALLYTEGEKPSNFVLPRVCTSAVEFNLTREGHALVVLGVSNIRSALKEVEGR